MLQINRGPAVFSETVPDPTPLDLTMLSAPLSIADPVPPPEPMPQISVVMRTGHTIDVLTELKDGKDVTDVPPIMPKEEPCAPPMPSTPPSTELSTTLISPAPSMLPSERYVKGRGATLLKPGQQRPTAVIPDAPSLAALAKQVAARKATMYTLLAQANRSQQAHRRKALAKRLLSFEDLGFTLVSDGKKYYMRPANWPLSGLRRVGRASLASATSSLASDVRSQTSSQTTQTPSTTAPSTAPPPLALGPVVALPHAGLPPVARPVPPPAAPAVVPPVRIAPIAVPLEGEAGAPLPNPRRPFGPEPPPVMYSLLNVEKGVALEWRGDNFRVFELNKKPVPRGPETTTMLAGRPDFEMGDFYISNAGGPIIRFHRKTVASLASRLSTTLGRSTSIAQRDEELAFVALNSTPAVFRMAAKPVKEGGFNYDPERDPAFLDEQGFSRASALYAAEAVAQALRTASEMRRAVRVDRNFIVPDRFGVQKGDVKRDLKALSDAYGKPVHGCSLFKRKCRRFWQKLKHPWNESLRTPVYDFDLPAPQRRIADTMALHTRKNDRIKIGVMQDAMRVLAANIKGKGPVVPAVQNFH